MNQKAKPYQIAFSVLVGLFSSNVYAHDIYNDLTNKQGTMNCCHEKDCKATEYRRATGGVEFKVDNTWVFVPEDVIQYKIIPGDVSTNQAHWCGRKIISEGYDSYNTFCAFLPPNSI